MTFSSRYFLLRFLILLDSDDKRTNIVPSGLVVLHVCRYFQQQQENNVVSLLTFPGIQDVQKIHHNQQSLRTIAQRKGSRKPTTAVDLLPLLDLVHRRNLRAVKVDFQVNLAFTFHWLVVASGKTSLDMVARGNGESSSLANE